MHGVIVVDKPVGRTSYDVIREVRRLLRVDKAGHTGTLDPLATGVLPVCVNEATKLVQFFSGDSKDYRATMLLGVETDTLDIDGKILSTKHTSVRREEVEDVLRGFLGSIRQIPPHYSAVKFQGRTLHSWARKGVSVERPARTVEIHRIELLDVQWPYVTFFVSCSKGTYIRSLCAEAGERLGSKGCLAGLRRVRSGRFREEDALSLDEMRKGGCSEGRVISMVDALTDFSAISIDDHLAERLRAGHQPFASDFEGNNIPSLAAGDMVMFVHGGKRLVAVGKMLWASKDLPSLKGKEKLARIVRVFKS